jgi:tetratricopeptide (TPR) repeat protein
LKGLVIDQPLFHQPLSATMKKETWFCLVFLACALLIGVGFVGKTVIFPSLFSKTNKESNSQESVQKTAPAQAPLDPRLEYTGPFQNIHPNVKYIGSEKCADCHVEIARNYARHPMARTLLPMADLADSLPYDQEHKNPFQAFNSQFRIERRDGRVHHQCVGSDEASNLLFQIDLEAQYAVGSGSRGHSFVTNRDGYLFQTAISWFSQEKKWGLSPGFTSQLISGRPIGRRCMFCHANRALPLDGYENRFQPPIFQGLGIGCERCHGPGEKHYRKPGRFTKVSKEEAEASTHLAAGVREFDATIVHPGKLKPALREAICQQCHLAGEERILPRGRNLYDFRPGLPLESCWSIFVQAWDAGANYKAVNHVEQMYLSRCFQKSKETNKLGCISCHDPHEHIGSDRRVTHYRNRCLTCHRDKENKDPERVSCSFPLAQRLKENREDSCIHCHMPPYRASDIVHNASTNHRILRRPQKEVASPAELPGNTSLVLFPQKLVNIQDPERSRDLGIALSHLAMKKKASREQVQSAIWLLEKTLHPDDLDAWEHKAKLLFFQGRMSQALAATESILQKQPNHEIACAQAGAFCADSDKAVLYWRRAVTLNPWMPRYRAALAQLNAQLGNWTEAKQEGHAWLRLEPTSIDARKLRIQCLLQEGQVREARAEFDRIVALKPPNLKDLRSWLAKQLK